MNPAPDQPPSSSEPSTVTHSVPVAPTVPASTNLNKPLINNLPANNVSPTIVQPSISIPQPLSPDVSNPPATIQDVPITTTSSISPASNPPFEPPIVNASTQTVSQLSAKHQSKKFPFMMVTFLLALVIAGFTGSFLFFSYTKAAVPKVPVQILITPPVTLEPTIPSTPTPNVNPFATSSADMVNPFASPTASLANPFSSFQNPFSVATPSSSSSQTYQNPFTTATASSQSSQPYQNPFETLK